MEANTGLSTVPESIKGLCADLYWSRISLDDFIKKTGYSRDDAIRALSSYRENRSPETDNREPVKFGYARVSTVGQAKDGNSLEAQETALRAAGAQELFIDKFTGTKLERPEFERLRAQLRSGDTLIVTKLDRFARTVGQASELITELIDSGVTVNVLNLGILDNSSMSVLMRNILLSFAQFERDMIVQRTQEGKSVARTKPGYREGRKPKYTQEQLQHALELLSDHSYGQVTKMTGISKSTLIRYKKSDGWTE